MRLPENFIQEVIERTDIEELIGRYVTLKRAGSNLLGLCPFHSEKTPSFTVTPSKQMFYCFGCHAGGSAITFVQKAENLEFFDAVEFLANRIGLPMPRDASGALQEGGVSRKRVLEMNLEAAKFFRACLFDPNIGKPGMDYLKGKRRLTDATIKHFGLGYAPEGFGMLTDHMHRLGYTDEELQTAFLCGKSQKTGRSYDYFRNRVIFPIIDPVGQVVAFGGRVLDDSKPKYLNTSDTPAFRKSNHLFALNFAKNCTASSEQMILCEGYMDVISLHAAGFEFAVATLGTAITPNHARIFSKYTKKVIISYDSDQAGQNAANKAMHVLGEVGMDVRVLNITGAKDPDEYIQKFGADKFRQTLGMSRTGFEYKLDVILSKYDVSISTDKIRASGDLCRVIAEYASGVEREVYLAQVAAKLELPIDVLRNSVEEIRKKGLRALRGKESREAQSALKRFGDRVNPDAATVPKATAIEENVLGLLLIFPEYRAAVAGETIALSAEDFVTAFNKRVFEAIMRMQNTENGFRFELLGAEFSPDEVGRIEKMEVTRQALTQNGPDAFRTVVQNLRAFREEKDARGKDLTEQLAYLRQKKSKLHKGKVDPT